jgi:hypothetical protein
MSDHEIGNTIVTVNVELEHLKLRVRDLEQALNNLPTRQLPEGWLFSPDFMKRAFAIWGHNIVAGLIVSTPFWCLWGFIAVMAASN